jgi:Secretion system C-terminal sorting domain
LYSSMVVGQWNTATGAGGDNIALNAVWKTQSGVVVVGKATAGGNAMPTANVPTWGSATENGTESAVLAYLSATNLYNANDGMAVVVPVELINFGGYTEGSCNGQSQTKNSACRHILTWQTASEINTQSFDIQRLIKNNAFETIGTVKPKNKAATYSFNTVEPIENINYYRLKIVDTDGKTAYSNVISLENNKTRGNPKIYPNPAFDILTIENVEGTPVEILNILGQKIKTFTASNTPLIVLITDLEKGIYFVKSENGTVRFVKQ